MISNICTSLSNILALIFQQLFQSIKLIKSGIKHWDGYLQTSEIGQLQHIIKSSKSFMKTLNKQKIPPGYKIMSFVSSVTIY